ncbi:unnamed protein product [Cunninghamella blakesleeana]
MPCFYFSRTFFNHSKVERMDYFVYVDSMEYKFEDLDIVFEERKVITFFTTSLPFTTVAAPPPTYQAADAPIIDEDSEMTAVPMFASTTINVNSGNNSGAINNNNNNTNTSGRWIKGNGSFRWLIPFTFHETYAHIIHQYQNKHLIHFYS